MGGGTRVENLKRAALLVSGLKPAEFDPFFWKIEVASNKGVWRMRDVPRRCRVQAIMWFIWTMITHGGEFGYEFLCRTISNYAIILVKSSCVNWGQQGEVPRNRTTWESRYEIAPSSQRSSWAFLAGKKISTFFQMKYGTRKNSSVS